MQLMKLLGGSYEGRGFGRNYVWTYICPICESKMRMRCNSWKGLRRTASGNLVGITPQSPGAIACEPCAKKSREAGLPD